MSYFSECILSFLHENSRFWNCCIFSRKDFRNPLEIQSYCASFWTESPFKLLPSIWNVICKNLFLIASFMKGVKFQLYSRGMITMNESISEWISISTQHWRRLARVRGISILAHAEELVLNILRSLVRMTLTLAIRTKTGPGSYT